MDNKQKVMSRLIAKGGWTKLIAAKCVECIYDPDAPGNGTWRQQTEACTCKICPLYSVRPLSSAGSDSEDGE